METGYTYLINMPNEQLSKLLRVTEKKANDIKTMTFPELCRYEEICIEEKGILNIRGKCRDKAYNCHLCRKEFLENELP